MLLPRPGCRGAGGGGANRPTPDLLAGFSGRKGKGKREGKEKVKGERGQKGGGRRERKEKRGGRNFVRF